MAIALPDRHKAQHNCKIMRFIQRTAPLGICIDLDSTTAVLELLDETDRS